MSSNPPAAFESVFVIIDVTPAFYDQAHLERVLRAVMKLQRVLGDFNDARGHERRLLDCGRAMSAAGAPPGALLALRRPADQNRQRGRRLRSQVTERLSRFSAHDTGSACRRAGTTGRGR